MVSKYFIVGALGDISLQMYISNYGDVAGLEEYFKQHGTNESIVIAGGLMAMAKFVFLALGLPNKPIPNFLFGGCVDIAFRYGHIFPSLEGYYTSMNPFESFVWGGIPMVIPFIFSNNP